MYGGGQGNSALVGIKRDADMTAYGQVRTASTLCVVIAPLCK